MNQSYVRSPLSIDWSTRAVLYNVTNITSPKMLWLAVCSQNMCTPLHQFCTIERSVKFCDTRSDLVESTHSNARMIKCACCVLYRRNRWQKYPACRHCIMAEKWPSIVMWLHSVGSAKCVCLTIKIFSNYIYLNFAELCLNFALIIWLAMDT